jgi:hypothetical protein
MVYYLFLIQILYQCGTTFAFIIFAILGGLLPHDTSFKCRVELIYFFTFLF